MTFRTTGLIAALGGCALLVQGLSSSPVFAQRDARDADPKAETPQQKLNPKVAKALQAAQSEMQKSTPNWEVAFAHVQDAKAVSERTPYDDFQISELLGYIELKRENFAQSFAAFEQSFASGQLPESERSNRLKLLTQLALQIKDYPKATQYATRAIEGSAAQEPEMHAMLAQAQYLSDNYQPAAEAAARAIELAQKAGKPAQENWLQIKISSHAKLNDMPGLISALQQLAIQYPRPKYLQDLFGQWKQAPDDDRIMVNVYRLQMHINGLTRPEDYLTFARAAFETGMPAETVRILEKAQAEKVFTHPDDVALAKQQRESAQPLATEDRQQVKAAEGSSASRSANDAVQLGMALVSFGEYLRGAEALKRGISQGGIKQPDQAQLILGQALVELNRLEEAKAAFDSVDASSKLKTVAQLWSAYTAPLPPEK